VDKGVLRTEKQNFLFFDMPTHPLANMSTKDELVRRVCDTLLGRGPPPDKHMIALVVSAYAASVLENALTHLTHTQREQAITRVDELLQEYQHFTEKTGKNSTEIMAGVFSVYGRMDSIL
jgi:Golgi phosphoprotein 3